MDLVKIISLCLLATFSLIAGANDSNNIKRIPISMGMNLNEPQSQVNTVTHAQITADLAKSFRPFDESIYKRVTESLVTKGIGSVNFKSEDPALNPVFIDEYMDSSMRDLYTIQRDDQDDSTERASFSVKDYLPLNGFSIRVLVNYFAQQRYRQFSEFGVTVNEDRSVLLKKGSYVYTTGLESAQVGDVPNGIYPLYYDGDVDVAVEGFAKFITCPEKYSTAKKCLNIEIPQTPSSDGIKLTFTANSDTHLKNFHLILPTVNHEEVLQGKIVFNPDYLEYIKPFSTFRVMNTLLASPKSPFECVTTYVKNRNVYSLPKQKLESEYLEHQVNIKLLERIKEAQIESSLTEAITPESIIYFFKTAKNEDNEPYYSDEELDAIVPLTTKLLSQPGYLNLLNLDYRIQQSKDAMIPLKEKLVVLRRKTSEFNWNYVNPNEDYGNCLLKFSRTSSDRAKLHHQFWGNSYIRPEERWRGLPYEVIVELINQTKSNVWVNIPHNASINYVKDMSQYFKDHLHKDAKVFVELSNEVWNGGFAGQKYFIGLANHRYEYYVTAFLNQFENYLKTSNDKLVSYHNFRKGYLEYFYHFKKEIIKELDQFKFCKKQSDTNQLVNHIKYTDKGLSIGQMSKADIFEGNMSTCKLSKDNRRVKNETNKPELNSSCNHTQIRLTDHGLTIGQLIQLKETDKGDVCKTFVQNNYQGTDDFINKIAFKKGNFFERLALKIPAMSAYWLGYTGAVKGKLKIQIPDKEGNYKDTWVDRFKYIKEHKYELHSPDLVYHYSGDEIRDLEKELFIEFKKGWNKRVNSQGAFDFNKNAEIFVLKNLDRAYKVMAQMAYVDRLDHIAKIWLDSGIDKKKIIITLATKQNNPNLTKYMLNYAKTTDAVKRIDAIATAAYFYGCFGDLKIDGEVIKPYKFGPCKDISKGVLTAKNTTELLDILQDPRNPKGVIATEKQIREHKEIINKVDKRIKLVAYEGGHNLALVNLGRKQQKYLDQHPKLKEEKLALLKETIQHKRMGELTKELYKTWLNNDGRAFNNFNMPQSFHQWGSLGLSLSLSDRSTPRYLAASEYAHIFSEMDKNELKQGPLSRDKSEKNE